MAKSIKWTPDDIKALRMQATKGSQEALAELKTINREVAKVANVRLGRLEKAGHDIWAYKKAQTYIENIGANKKTGKIRFPEGAMAGNARDLENNIQAAIEFVNAKTSTLTGYNAVRSAKIKVFNDMDIYFDSVVEEDDFLRFLGNDEIQQILKAGSEHDSAQIVEKIKNGIKGGFTYQGIKEMFDKLNKGEQITLDGVTDRLENPQKYKNTKYLHKANNETTFYQRKKR